MTNLVGGRRTPRLSPITPSSKSLQVSYLDRIDPIHEVEYKDVVGSRWDRVSVVEQALAVSANGTLIHGNRASESPITISPVRLYTPITIRAFAALDQFHQLSSLQVAALTGGSVTRVHAALRNLFAAGVIERSVNNVWTHSDPDDRYQQGVGSLWQINGTSPRTEEWISGLSDLEHSLLSGGRDMSKGSAGSSGSSSIRHNMTLAEIVIRSMELCPGVIGGWGEPMTTTTSLAPTMAHIRANIADGAIVGKDGSIVLIETSGQSNIDHEGAGERLSKKATAWAAIAARSDLPIKVVFVNIASKARMQRFNHHIQKGISRINEHITKSSVQQKGKDSIFVANALDWFPFTLGVSEGFLDLEAYSTESDRYHSVIPRDVELNPHADAVQNTLAALHVPAWIAMGS